MLTGSGLSRLCSRIAALLFAWYHLRHPATDDRRLSHRMKLFSTHYTAAVSLLAAIIASSASAQGAYADGLGAASTLSASTVVTEHAPDMVSNFERVSAGIWRGAAPSDRAIEALAHDGVKTIVDLRMDGSGVAKESDQAKHLGLHYYHFPLGFNHADDGTVRDILSIMTNPVNQPVFIHCRQGADRTGMLVGIYRRMWLGWSFKQTWNDMRRHHFKPFLFTMKNQVKNVGSNHLLEAMQASAAASENKPVPVSNSEQSIISIGDEPKIEISSESQLQ